MAQRPKDGVPEIVLRPIGPGDKQALAQGLRRLSARSVHQRFLGAKPRFSSAELRYLTEVDFLDHYALVAVLAGDPGTVVGVGRWVRDAGAREQAEVAVVVADDLQGRGLGTTIGIALGDAARRRGIRRFTAIMLPENVAAHRLFARISQRLTVTHDGAVDALVAELAA